MGSPIPLQHNFSDIIAKAQRGLNVSDSDLAAQAGISADQLAKAKAGELDQSVAEKLAPVLNLCSPTLLETARQAWSPEPLEVEGLHQYSSSYEGRNVNAYLVFDILTKTAIVFDSGADSVAMLNFIRARWLRAKMIFLTHVHSGHILALGRLKRDTGATIYVSDAEPMQGTEPFAIGKGFNLGNFEIQSRPAPGHDKGAVIYIVSGLKRKVAIVGNAIYCGSIGDAAVSYDAALRTVREQIFTLPDNTALCPACGPMTTVAEQKQHNPFFPEFRH